MTPRRTQRIRDGLTGQKIYRSAGKWLARLPRSLPAPIGRDYRWQLPGGKIEFSTTMGLGRPVTGRIFSGRLIRTTQASAARIRRPSSFLGEAPAAGLRSDRYPSRR